MSEHLNIHETSLPPPRRAHVARDERRPGVVHRLAPATVFAGTLVMIALAILSALTLLVATPAGFAVPTTLLLIGVLAAGSLAIRTPETLSRRAPVPQSPAGSRGSEPRQRRARTAREDRAMLLDGGWEESWRPRR
jgi:hypothetical protein